MHNFQISESPPISLTLLINMKLKTAIIMPSCTTSVQITAFIPPYNRSGLLSKLYSVFQVFHIEIIGIYICRLTKEVYIIQVRPTIDSDAQICRPVSIFNMKL